MSQTAMIVTSSLQNKDTNAQLGAETLQGSQLTKKLVFVKSQSEVYPTENQLSTEDPEECNAEDIKYFEKIGRELTQEVLYKQGYKNEFEKIGDRIKHTQAANLPFPVKIKIMESTMDEIKTRINCIKEVNSTLQGIISNVENDENSKLRSMKSQVYSTDNSSKSNSSKPKITWESFQETSTTVTNDTKESEKQEKTIDKLKKDIKDLEEVIAQLKEKKNSLVVTIESVQDNIEDMQTIIQDKKQALERKSLYAENLKQGLSKNDIKKSTNKSKLGSHKKTSSEVNAFSLKKALKFTSSKEKPNDLNVSSRLETSVIKDVSSKLGNVFGKMGSALGLKKNSKNSNQILSGEFLDGLSLQSTPVSLNNSYALNNRHDMNLSVTHLN